jgi:hypothetical protein
VAADRWLDEHHLRLRIDDCDTAVKLLGAVAAGRAEQEEVTTWVHAHVRPCEEATMFERFTDRASRTLAIAEEESKRLGHGFIGTEHLLLALLGQPDALAGQVLADVGVDLEAARSRVIAIVGTGSDGDEDSRPFTPRAKKVLELALREAVHMGHNYIGTEHLLLGIAREDEGVGARVLREFGLGRSLDQLREQVKLRLGVISGESSGRRPRWKPRGKAPAANVCSFCGKSRQEVTKIVAGPNVGICNECIDLCNQIIAEQLGRSAAPTCPSCGRSIGEDARTETISLGDVGPIRVLFCGGCGATLGTVA